jgi:alpha-glucosidase
VPLPWSGDAPPFGFSPAGAAGEPWLPQPAAWRGFTAEAEAGDPSSMLELYRKALAIRHAEAGLGDGPMTWLDAPDGVLSFTRPGGFACVVNLSDVPVALPEHTEILLRSGPLDGLLPTDSAVWLRTA